MESLRPRRLLAAGGLAIMVAVLLAVPASAAGRALSAPSTRSAANSAPLTATSTIGTPLTVNRSSANLSSTFWGTTVSNEVRPLHGEANDLNATPARVLVFPGAMAGDDFDPLTNTHYDSYSGVSSKAPTTELQFVQMCKATHCQAVFELPAEIDNPSYAEKIVNYTEKNLSFTPAYFMIGNEPELWYHWKESWSQWSGGYSGGPTPTQFGQEVLAYVKAIRHVDNTTPILGLPASGCTCGYWTFEQWISAVLNVTGNAIQSVAFHEYPAGWLGTGDGSLHDFYSTIQSAAGIPARVAGARQAVIDSTCKNCSNVSVWISELGAALSWSAYGGYSFGLSGALSIASQITQAMDVNLSNIDLFATELGTSNSWFGPNGFPRPDYTLYTEILNHLGSQAFPVNLTGLDRTIYGIDTIAPSDSGRRDLMVVNDNITHPIAFSPAFAEYRGNAPVEAWVWNGSVHYSSANYTTWVEPATPEPVPTLFPDGLPANFTLAPQAIVLFEGFPSGGTFVRLTEQGAPAGTPWFATVGSAVHRALTPNVTLLLAPGAYGVGAAPIPLPVGGKEYHPVEQLAAYPLAPLTVGGPFTNATLHFVKQWRVNLSASPSAGGMLSSTVGWWNASQPLTVSVSQTLGYAFLRWGGWGAGAYNGTGRSMTIVPTGPVKEIARFVVGSQVNLEETGLPSGAPWNVTVRGFTTNGSGNVITVYEPNGKFGFQIHSIPGYRPEPRFGGLHVNSGTLLVPIHFARITPPQPAFSVDFQLSGLPASTPVSVTVRGLTHTATQFEPVFHLINGSYVYSVSYVPGYHLDTNVHTFEVTGGGMLLGLHFVPTVYRVSWEAYGAQPWMNWSVSLGGTPLVANSSWITAALTNGTYPYTISLPSNFTASPRSGLLQIVGGAVVLPISFRLLVFPAAFVASGLNGAGAWSVRLGDTMQSTTDGSPSFMAANGTYTFDVHPPAGFYAVPSHGNVTVAGGVAPVAIQFHPSSIHPSAALVAALSSGALSVSIWLGLSIGAGFVLFRAVGRRSD
ncbi:MAG TPA: hypothetical protein VFF67_00750 [Thermoplasmata archaeon]|nr:hypothetical protein [Thermoplasmata archaeon]